MGTSLDVPDILAQTSIFAGLSRAHIDLIAAMCGIVECSAGDIVFEQGAGSDSLYIVASGEVDILIDRTMLELDSQAEMVTITTVRRGEVFGEIALVDQGVRSATARCGQTDTTLVVIPRAGLMRLCEKKPVVGYNLMFNLARDLASTIRTRTTDLQIREWLTWSRGAGQS
jgi:CRP-like cAMP-binding protein